MHDINLSVLMAQGHSHLYFYLEIVKTALGLLFLAAGSLFGVTGIAWGVGCYRAVGFVINAYYTQRHLGYGALAQIRDFLPIIAESIPMALGVYYLGGYWHVAPGIKLFAQIVTGVAVFLLTGWRGRLAASRDAMSLLPRQKAVIAQISILRNYCP